MADCMLNRVELRGVTVVKGGVSIGLRLGFDTANGTNPASQISSRHPSQGVAETGQEPGRRRDQTANHGLDCTANGAGRTPWSAGVLVRRSPARFAGGAVPYGWPPALRRKAIMSCPGLRTGYRVMANPAGLCPAGETLSASTRGKGDRGF
jgi:hypothetical protein